MRIHFTVRDKQLFLLGGPTLEELGSIKVADDLVQLTLPDFSAQSRILMNDLSIIFKDQGKIPAHDLIRGLTAKGGRCCVMDTRDNKYRAVDLIKDSETTWFVEGVEELSVEGWEEEKLALRKLVRKATEILQSENHKDIDAVVRWFATGKKLSKKVDGEKPQAINLDEWVEGAERAYTKARTQHAKNKAVKDKGKDEA